MVRNRTDWRSVDFISESELKKGEKNMVNDSFNISRYLNWGNLIKIIIAIPALAMAFFVANIIYKIIDKNSEVIIDKITPYVIDVVAYGTVAIVAIVVIIVILAIIHYSKRMRY